MSPSHDTLNTRRLGISWMRHPRIPGGPLVWTILIRVGRKRILI